MDLDIKYNLLRFFGAQTQICFLNHPILIKMHAFVNLILQVWFLFFYFLGAQSIESD